MLIDLPKLETVVTSHPEWAEFVGIEEKFHWIGHGAYLHDGFNSGIWIARAYDDDDFNRYPAPEDVEPELVIGQVEYDTDGSPRMDLIPAHAHIGFDIAKISYTSDIILAKFGVCDTPNQLLEWPEMASVLANPDRKYVVIFTMLRRNDQPETCGWRWHKWGDYIGLQDPQCEYLYDEPDIDVVYVYHIHDVTNLKGVQ